MLAKVKLLEKIGLLQMNVLCRVQYYITALGPSIKHPFDPNFKICISLL